MKNKLLYVMYFLYLKEKQILKVLPENKLLILLGIFSEYH